MPYIAVSYNGVIEGVGHTSFVATSDAKDRMTKEGFSEERVTAMLEKLRVLPASNALMNDFFKDGGDAAWVQTPTGRAITPEEGMALVWSRRHAEQPQQAFTPAHVHRIER